MKAVNALNTKEKLPQQPSDANKNISTKDSKNLVTKDKISNSRSNLSSPGILKSNLEERKPSNTVKFSRKNEIRIIGPAQNKEGERKASENARRKPSGNIRRQSRDLLRRINQEKDSESEGYHSDCMSSNVLRKKSSLARRQKYSNKQRRKDSKREDDYEKSKTSLNEKAVLSKSNNNNSAHTEGKSLITRKTNCSHSTLSVNSIM